MNPRFLEVSLLPLLLVAFGGCVDAADDGVHPDLDGAVDLRGTRGDGLHPTYVAVKLRERLTYAYVELPLAQQDAIESGYVATTQDRVGFRKWAAAQTRDSLSCWNDPGEMGCWIETWVVACVQTTTSGPWQCVGIHEDDLD
ncbi:MAG: hypothetical protein KC731_10585 [Myxococcales bacterium]|nr:hypothetical protein [Myxococcales bacterium]